MAIVTPIIRANVDAEVIEAILEVANLPMGSIWLIIGDDQLDSCYQALTIGHAQVRYAAKLYGLEAFRGKPWDCGILISRYWSMLQQQFPAYFAFLLGHEFGHAATVLSDFDLTICEEFIKCSIRTVAPDREWRWGDLPHEIRYDQFGLSIAERIYGRTAVEADFSTIISGGYPVDSDRLQNVLSRPSCVNLDGLREEVALFCYPYRSALLELWREQMVRRNRRGERERVAFEELMKRNLPLV